MSRVEGSMLKLVWAVAALTLSTCVYAVGMGGINVTSALGQPLKADIELVVVSKAEKTSLVARLASPDVYKGAGLEYPHGNKFKLQIESRADGGSYIKVSSDQPINDPFVSLLVDLSWASGRLLREYTFLIDPPDYVAEQPKPEEVRAVAPTVQPAAVMAKPAVQVAPAPVESTHVEKQVSIPAVTGANGSKAGIITVNSNDTLSKIAAKNKPADMSLEQMLVALYRANVDEFDGKNMNRIKVGKILRMPVNSEMRGVSQTEAVNEIRAQAADWNAYRQKLADVASNVSQPHGASATGKITSVVADSAPVVKESAREVLKLSRG